MTLARVLCLVPGHWVQTDEDVDLDGLLNGFTEALSKG